jgi:hypothetical protein
MKFSQLPIFVVNPLALVLQHDPLAVRICNNMLSSMQSSNESDGKLSRISLVFVLQFGTRNTSELFAQLWHGKKGKDSFGRITITVQ